MESVSMEIIPVPGDFVCTNCEGHIEYPNVVVFTSTEYGVDSHMPCPYCGQETLAEADKCECGNWKPRFDIVCEKCKKESINRLGIFTRSLRKSQLEYLDGIIEGTALEEYR